MRRHDRQLRTADQGCAFRGAGEYPASGVTITVYRRRTRGAQPIPAMARRPLRLLIGRPNVELALVGSSASSVPLEARDGLSVLNGHEDVRDIRIGLRTTGAIGRRAGW